MAIDLYGSTSLSTPLEFGFAIQKGGQASLYLSSCSGASVSGGQLLLGLSTSLPVNGAINYESIKGGASLAASYTYDLSSSSNPKLIGVDGTFGGLVDKSQENSLAKCKTAIIYSGFTLS